MIRSKLVLAGLVAAALVTATAIAPAAGFASYPSAPPVGVDAEGKEPQTGGRGGDPDDPDSGDKGGMTCCFN